MSADVELTAQVLEAATEAGFARVGVAEAGRLHEEAEYLDAWLDAERHGQMSWMATTAEVRKDPRDPNMLAGARSVVVMAAPYAGPEARPGPTPARVAKYAVGRDYHNVLLKRARRVAKHLQHAGYVARVAIDSKPVFERAWAERAGVGFVGKNCCLIVPGIGSHVFLACLVTTAELCPGTPIERRCGDCRLCLDACPTRAFEGPRTLDARRCISYLTIEHRGPIPEEHRRAIGPWLFGCDICQDVCPYNRGAAARSEPLPAFAPGKRWDGIEAETFLAMSDDEFRSWAAGSAVKRGGRDALARNAAIVLGNRGGAVHLPVLREAGRSHSSEVVREAAAWGERAISRRLGAGE